MIITTDNSHAAKRLTIAAMLWLLLANNLHAQNLSSSGVLREQIQRENINNLNSLQQVRQKNLREAQQQNATDGKAANNIVNIAGVVDKKSCLPWLEVKIAGIELLNARGKKQVNAALPSGCFGEAELNTLSQVVSAAFLAQGYFRINVSQQQQGKNLLWQVTPSKIVRIDNETQLKNSALFPGLRGKAANIFDLDQGIEQSNRLKGHHLSLDVFPEGNDLSIKISDEARGDLHGAIQTHNRGQKSTGRGKVDAYLSFDNPLGMADKISLQASSTTSTDARRYSRSANLLYSIPYGYWTFSTFAGLNNYRADFQLPSKSWAKFGGDMWQIGARAENVISRGSKHVTSVYGQLTRNAVTNKFLGQRLQNSSYDLTTAALGANHTFIFAGNAIGANAQYNQGLSILGADKDSQSSELPQAQFKKVNASIDWTHVHAKKWRFNHRLYAQHAWDRLPPVEQLGLSDNFAVRGLKDVAVVGDSGVFLRQNINLDFELSGVKLSPFLGLDVGRTHFLGQQWQTALGASLGINAMYKDISLGISVDKGQLHSPGAKTQTLPASFYVEATWQF